MAESAHADSAFFCVLPSPAQPRKPAKPVGAGNLGKRLLTTHSYQTSLPSVNKSQLLHQGLVVRFSPYPSFVAAPSPPESAGFKFTPCHSPTWPLGT